MFSEDLNQAVVPYPSGARRVAYDLTAISAVLFTRSLDFLSQIIPLKFPNGDGWTEHGIMQLVPRNPECDSRRLFPTQMTGLRWVDRVNRFLDELLVEDTTLPNERICRHHHHNPGGNTNEHTTVSPTRKTGNPITDGLNAFLDDLLVAPSQGRPSIPEPVIETRPRSTMKQRFRCLLQCRDQCKFDCWDCAGLKFQSGIQDHLPLGARYTCNNPEHQALYEDPNPGLLMRFMKYMNGRDSEKFSYDEKWGERIAPGLCDRSAFYCPHCHKNRFTGKEQIDLTPNVGWACVNRCDRGRDVDEVVDFNIEDFIR